MSSTSAIIRLKIGNIIGTLPEPLLVCDAYIRSLFREGIGNKCKNHHHEKASTYTGHREQNTDR